MAPPWLSRAGPPGCGSGAPLTASRRTAAALQRRVSVLARCVRFAAMAFCGWAPRALVAAPGRCRRRGLQVPQKGSVRSARCRGPRSEQTPARAGPQKAQSGESRAAGNPRPHSPSRPAPRWLCWSRRAPWPGSDFGQAPGSVSRTVKTASRHRQKPRLPHIPESEFLRCRRSPEPKNSRAVQASTCASRDPDPNPAPWTLWLRAAVRRRWK